MYYYYNYYKILFYSRCQSQAQRIEKHKLTSSGVFSSRAQVISPRYKRKKMRGHFGKLSEKHQKSNAWIVATGGRRQKQTRRTLNIHRGAGRDNETLVRNSRKEQVKTGAGNTKWQEVGDLKWDTGNEERNKVKKKNRELTELLLRADVTACED